ncbi:MAG: hypothetical protein AAGA99_04025 [Actinomycetota bacterium]
MSGARGLARRLFVRRWVGAVEHRVEDVVDNVIPTEREAMIGRVQQVDLRLTEVGTELDEDRHRLSERVDLVVDEAVRRAEAADARLITEIQRLERRVAELEARLHDDGS